MGTGAEELFVPAMELPVCVVLFSVELKELKSWTEA